jgi:hypothetical protein
LYLRFEARRCLAVVRFLRFKDFQKAGNNDHAQTELDQAERLCGLASDLVEPTESRVSRLWLGPVYIRVLLAKNKRDEAAEKLAAYQTLVSECQSPRFRKEAEQLHEMLNR